MSGKAGARRAVSSVLAVLVGMVGVLGVGTVLTAGPAAGAAPRISAPMSAASSDVTNFIPLVSPVLW
jgi:hypothetical protein